MTKRNGISGVTYRQIIALLALINAFVATYLHLWKLGKAGTLTCGGSGGCAIVQFSQWSWFLGFDVALIGAVGYTLIFAVALAGGIARFGNLRWPSLTLAALAFPAFVFTLRLKWAEFYMLKTFCPWCAISAVSITIISVLVILDLRSHPKETANQRDQDA